MKTYMSGNFVTATFLILLTVLGITEFGPRQLLTLSVLFACLLVTYSIKKGSTESLTIILAYLSISASHYVLRLPMTWGSDNVLALKPAFLLLMCSMLMSQTKNSSDKNISEWLRALLFTSVMLIVTSIVGYLGLRSSYSLEPLVFKGVIQNILFIFASYLTATGIINSIVAPSTLESTV